MDKATVMKQEVSAAAPAAVEEEEQPSLVDWKSIWKPMSVIVGLFLLFFYLPVESGRFTGAGVESLALAKWYAQEHVLLCLVPALFIAGGISAFVSQTSVMRYLGPKANKAVAYGVGHHHRHQARAEEGSGKAL